MEGVTFAIIWWQNTLYSAQLATCMYMQLERILPQWNSVVAYITVSYVIRPDSFEFLVISQCPSYIVSDEPVSLQCRAYTAYCPWPSFKSLSGDSHSIQYFLEIYCTIVEIFMISRDWLLNFEGSIYGYSDWHTLTICTHDIVEWKCVLRIVSTLYQVLRFREWHLLGLLDMAAEVLYSNISRKYSAYYIYVQASDTIIIGIIIMLAHHN